MFKHHIIANLRGLALLSIFVALVAGAFAAPGRAAAAGCGGVKEVMCIEARLYLLDDVSGQPVANAKVALTDVNGNTVYAYAAEDTGWYSAMVEPGDYKVYVSAMGYMDTQADVSFTAGSEAHKVVVAADRRAGPAASARPLAQDRARIAH